MHTCTKSCRHKNPGEGYYVMRWGGGRYTSVGWYLTKAEAQKEVDRIIMIGAWSGKKPKIELAERKNNPISDREALALTRKVIAYGKKLLMHEKGELRHRNPIEARHVEKFVHGIRQLDKYVVGSRQYIEALARAYEHLEGAKRELDKHKKVA